MANALEAAFRQQASASDELLFDDTGFTFDYQRYASPLTESPERYHSFAALAIVATAVGNKVFYHHGGGRAIYPNIWVALVGKSSQLKKSTAMRIASDLIYAHDEKLMYPEEFTSEALHELMEKQPTGIFCWGELGGLLKGFEKSYMQGTKELLTDLYDCPPPRTRKLMGKTYRIENACPCVLGASTVDWLNGNLKQVDLGSGFAARFVYVPAEKPSKILPRPPRRDEALRGQLLDALQSIASVSGEMSMTPEAGMAYDDWYRKMHALIGQLPLVSKVHSFASRLEACALKFAMIFQIARDRSLVITDDSVWRACQVSDWLFEQAKVLVDEEFACSDRERSIREVAQFIQTAGVVQKQQLTRAFRKHRARDLDEFLTDLQSSDQIKMDKGERGATIYKWTA